VRPMGRRPPAGAETPSVKHRVTPVAGSPFSTQIAATGFITPASASVPSAS
jgi:hypothetical protein